MDITVYATKENAKEAQDKVGGIILEVNAKCLAEVESKYGKEVFLSEGTDGEGNQSASAYITVCYDGLDSRDAPTYGGFEPGTVEPQGEIAEFGPIATAWFDELERETGYLLHQ